MQTYTAALHWLHGCRWQASRRGAHGLAEQFGPTAWQPAARLRWSLEDSLRTVHDGGIILLMGRSRVVCDSLRWTRLPGAAHGRCTGLVDLIDHGAAHCLEQIVGHDYDGLDRQASVGIAGHDSFRNASNDRSKPRGPTVTGLNIKAGRWT
jgi:hypothetical protein